MKNDSISVETQRRWLQGGPLKRSVNSGILVSYPLNISIRSRGKHAMQYVGICILFKCVLTIVREGYFCGGIVKRTASVKIWSNSWKKRKADL